MKRLAAIFLVMVLMTIQFAQYLVYVDFELNKQTILTTRCINRNNPITVCKGRCYLAKKVRQVSEKKKEQNARMASEKYFDLAAPDSKISMAFIRPLPVSKSVCSIPYINLYNLSLLIAFFHPPDSKA